MATADGFTPRRSGARSGRCSSAAARPRQQPRTLALLDVENLLLGDPADALADDYAEAIVETATRASLTATDSAMLGVGSRNRTGVFACLHTWPSAALRCRGGEDGADRALTEQVEDLAAVARSYQRVVVGSGDHHFIDCVRGLRQLGVRTTIVARPGKLSAKLRRAADEVLLLTGTGAGAGVLEHPVAA